MSLALPRPIDTSDLAGLPPYLTTVAQARDAIAAARLPVVRSRYAWLDVHNRLTLALTTNSLRHVEAAFIALSLAVAAEQIAMPEVALPLAA